MALRKSLILRRLRSAVSKDALRLHSWISAGMTKTPSDIWRGLGCQTPGPSSTISMRRFLARPSDASPPGRALLRLLSLLLIGTL